MSNLALLPHHQTLIDDSAISSAVATARGYRSVLTKADLQRLGFGPTQRTVPGLLHPGWNAAGELAGYQYRPDTPRVKDGKIAKYETPNRSRMWLDVPPSVRVMIGNPALPLWITEGIRKADAGASQDMCCIAVIGVWNWRGRNDDGGLTALSDWELIHLKEGRQVYLAFDSDQMTNRHVHAALKRLTTFLNDCGARVRIVYLEPGPSGAKVGLDDYFAAGGTVAALLARTEDGLRPLPWDGADDASGPYLATPAGFVYRKDTENGLVDQPLSNFTAHIVEEVIADDGADERVELVIVGDLDGQPLRSLRVSTHRFGSLGWVNGEWGARPIIAAGFGNRDRLREAIQRQSSDFGRRHVYQHPGWCHLPDHGWCYLHAGGGIGAAGVVSDVDVELLGAASRLLLPEPPSGDNLRAAARACLSLLDLAPDRITVPLFGAVYRSLLSDLAPADTSVFVVGPSGVFKSELAALAMQHVGATFDRLHLPAHWSATDNFLEKSTFDFKDAPLVIDDFAPSGSAIEIARLHAKADRVLRGVGNRGSRGRMWANNTQRPDFPPRGLVIGTGEDAPRGQSLRSRVVILDVAPGDVDRDRLSAAQAAGRAGTIASGLAGYLRWLAPRIDALREALPQRLTNFRARAHDDVAHARTPDAVAHLAIGWSSFLRFAAEIGALTQDEAQQAFARVWTALGEAASRQADYQAGEEPARRFLDLVNSALTAGYLHIASPEGRVPPFHPEAWGWRQERKGAGEYEQYEWRPQGTRVGWIDGEDLYLDLEAGLAGVHRVSQASGTGISVSSKTLAKRLHERGFLRSTEQKRGHLHVRHTLEGRRRQVLHLAATTIAVEDATQSAQSPPANSRPVEQRGVTSSNGPKLWADTVAVGGESAQEIGLEMPLSTSNGALGPIGPISKPGHPNGDDEEMLVPLPASPDDHSDAVEVSLPETESSRACDPWAADTQTRL